MRVLRRLLNRAGFYTRAQVRAATANYQAAAINRLTSAWTQTTLSADAQSRTDFKVSRARSRELRDNDPYAKKFVTMLKSNVLGDAGINFRSKIKDPDRVVGNELVPGRPDTFANKSVEEGWWTWGRKEYCTVTRLLTWCDVQRIVSETTAVDGNCLVRKIKTTREENPFGFTLQILESDLLDTEYNGRAENGNEIRMGVEIDQWHRRVAYHLLTQNPNDFFFFNKRGDHRYRLDASELVHVMVHNRTEQTIGTPWMVTAAFLLHMLKTYQEAETTAARAGASKMAFLTDLEGKQAQYEGPTDAAGNKIMEAEPGCIEQLPTGMDIKSLDWNHPNTAFPFFMKTVLRGISAGLGVSYNTLANDMESVNFASGKLGIEDERQMWKSVQYWLIESFHEPIFASWLEMALTTGAIPLPPSKFEKFNAPLFRGRRWDYVNPQQEVTAQIDRLNAGLTSISRICAEQDIDPIELFDEIAADKAALKARGITLSAVSHAPQPQEPDDPASGNPPRQPE